MSQYTIAEIRAGAEKSARARGVDPHAPYNRFCEDVPEEYMKNWKSPTPEDAKRFRAAQERAVREGRAAPAILER